LLWTSSCEKHFEVPLRASIFVIRKHRLEAPTFSTELAVSRRSADEIHPWLLNGGLRPRLSENSVRNIINLSSQEQPDE